jgi:cob(I)alamin adenosyltransferase
MTDSDINQRHKRRMERKKEIIDAHIEQAQDERGIIIVHTGNGKGKSSSAFGMVARALGHGMRVGVVQFIKGAFSTGEEHFFRRFPEVDYNVMGEGYTWDTQNRDRDIATANKAWEKAKSMLEDASYDLVILDEMNIVLQMNYVPLEDVVDALQNRPFMQHVVLTGRGAPDGLIEIADTVTEMKEIKHAYQAGVKAQKGVEL